GLFWCIQNSSPPVEAKGLKGVYPQACAVSFPTDDANVPMLPQVHISERLSALGITRHGFVLCRKGASVV
ncbi:hypothetical protein A2U01_0102766, partial [Trifolium medium]|nr:hypothetical protein [Trifolium medium]